MRRLPLLFSCACIVLSACRARDFGGLLLDKPGEFTCFDGQLLVTVAESPQNQLNVTLKRGEDNVNSPKPDLQKASPWAIYTETADLVWIYDGAKEVKLVTFATNGTSTVTSTLQTNGLLKMVPLVLRPRLAPELQAQSK